MQFSWTEWRQKWVIKHRTYCQQEEKKVMIHFGVRERCNNVLAFIAYALNIHGMWVLMIFAICRLSNFYWDVISVWISLSAPSMLFLNCKQVQRATACSAFVVLFKQI